MGKNTSTDAIKRAAERRKKNGSNGPQKAHGKNTGKNGASAHNPLNQGVSSKETYFGGRQADTQAKREARAQRDTEADAKSMEFAATQYMQAIAAPQVTKDRANGGVEGYARELAVRLIDLWALTTKEAAEAAGVDSRINLAIRQLTAKLRQEYAADIQAQHPEMSAQDVKAKVEERIKREYGLRGVAMRAARAAINYGYSKAKQGA